MSTHSSFDYSVVLDDGRLITARFILVGTRGARRAILDWLDLRGLALPWSAIWVLSEEDSAWLRAHESCHITQMHRDGRVVFLIRYFWQLFAAGYDSIDYEREANERADTLVAQYENL